MNAHAEEMRPFFVQHEGQKELIVTAGGNRYTVDFGKMAQAMSQQLKENVSLPPLGIRILRPCRLDQRPLATRLHHAQFHYHDGKRQSYLFGHDDEHSQVVSTSLICFSVRSDR